MAAVHPHEAPEPPLVIPVFPPEYRSLGLQPKDHTKHDPNIPDEPPPENTPPLGPVNLSVIPGYESVAPRVDVQADPTADPQLPCIPPPAYDELFGNNVTCPQEEFVQFSHITEADARAALLRMVLQRNCYGKGAALKMKINSVTPSNALHLILESYIETRTSFWHKERYIPGEPLDAPEAERPPPGPWNIRCTPHEIFKDESRLLRVPRTSHILPCPQCQALGHVRCTLCFGLGHTRCNWCQGLGYRMHHYDGYAHRRMCISCVGAGRKVCLRCHRTGRIICSLCKGYRNIRYFLALRVIFQNNLSEHIIERTDMSNILVKTVTGEMILEQTAVKVAPISTHPDREICDASHKLINNDMTRFMNARILMQRQRLRSVPVSECSYSYKGRDARFWVYGKEKNVEAPDYPDTTCWGCTVL